MAAVETVHLGQAEKRTLQIWKVNLGGPRPRFENEWSGLPLADQH